MSNVDGEGTAAFPAWWVETRGPWRASASISAPNVLLMFSKALRSSAVRVETFGCPRLSSFSWDFRRKKLKPLSLSFFFLLEVFSLGGGESTLLNAAGASREDGFELKGRAGEKCLMVRVS